ncbi:amidohydrolase family protein [Algoriphagus sp. SE2]|uniref:amidohydrolase family protein n=1 Tax=Algoriphagus sp. SE2 TaxID=3141536 RepID=UPI0031CD752B
MVKKIQLLLGIFILILSCTSKQDTIPSTVLTGAKIFIGNGEVIEDGVIIIQEGIITAIGGNETSIPENAELIDVKGKYITPGIVDAHVHFSQTGFFDARPGTLDIRDSIDFVKVQEQQKNHPERYYEAYLRSGVTAVYDLGGFAWTLDLQRSAENNPNAPHVAAAGLLLTPPSINKTTYSRTPTDSQFISITSSEIGIEAVRLNDSLGATGIKIHEIYLDDTVFMNSMIAVKNEIAARNKKMIVDAVTLEQAKQALLFGAKILAHSVGDQPIDEEFISLAKELDIIYCPTLVVFGGYITAYRSLKTGFEINDPNNVIDERTRNLLKSSSRFLQYFPDNVEVFFTERTDQMIAGREKITSENLKRVYDEGITIALSSDAGNPGTLHGISVYDEMEAMQKAGIPTKDIIQMATKNGALAMERANDFGTLENGKMADLIILTDDPSDDISNMRSITHVMKSGFLRPVKEPFEKIPGKE